jgi:hypothetical protein
MRRRNVHQPSHSNHRPQVVRLFTHQSLMPLLKVHQSSRGSYLCHHLNEYEQENAIQIVAEANAKRVWNAYSAKYKTAEAIIDATNRGEINPMLLMGR